MTSSVGGGERRLHGGWVGDVEVGARQRDDLMARRQGRAWTSTPSIPAAPVISTASCMERNRSRVGHQPPNAVVQVANADLAELAERRWYSQRRRS